MSADQSGDLGRTRLMGFERGDGVDDLARLFPSFDLAAAVEPDRGDRAGEGQATGRRIDPADLDRAGLGAAMPDLGRVGTAPDIAPGQTLELAIQVLLVRLYDRDVVGAFRLDQPSSLRLHRVHRIEGHDRARQGHPGQERAALAGLVRLRPHIALREGHRSGVVERREQMYPLPLGVLGPAQGLPIDRDRPQQLRFSFTCRGPR